MKKAKDKLHIGFVEGEEVILTFRRHWFYLLPSILVGLLGFVILLFFLLAVPALTEDSFLNSEVVFVVILIFLSLFFSAATKGYVNWYYNLYEITNKRIVLLRFGVGLKFKLQETVFDLVKSAEQTRSGFFGNILNFGHIRVATDNIASNAIFNIRYVKNPEQVMNVIQKLIVKTEGP